MPQTILPRDRWTVSDSTTVAAFASDLGLGVGEFPATFLIPGRGPDGAPVEFARESSVVDREGDLLEVIYTSRLGGFMAVIYND